MKPQLLCCLLLGLLACQPAVQQVNWKTLGAKTEKGYNAVIEIPAGTNHKIEVNKNSGTFEVDREDGRERVIDFLPYPGNYGFIPGTLMDKARGGDGDALDVLVIAESVPTGQAIEIQPIAALQLLDQGELDTKIIAVPTDSSLQVMHAVDFESFLLEYNMAMNIIQDWFLNYKGLGKMELQGWKDELYAKAEIEKWMLKSK